MKPKRLPPRLAPADPWRTWEKHGWSMLEHGEKRRTKQNGGFLYGESIWWIDVWWMYI